MNHIVHYVGLEVHKESIAVSIAPQNSSEVRRYGVIGRSLGAVDKLLKKLSSDNVELHQVYQGGPCGFFLCRYPHSRSFFKNTFMRSTTRPNGWSA